MIAPGILPLFDLYRVRGAGSGEDDPVCCGRAGGEVGVSARDQDNQIRSHPVGSVRDGLAMEDDWPWGMIGLAPAFMMHDSEENSETCWNREQQPVNRSTPSLDRPTTVSLSWARIRGTRPLLWLFPGRAPTSLRRVLAHLCDWTARDDIHQHGVRNKTALDIPEHVGSPAVHGRSHSLRHLWGTLVGQH